jgi:hypothetical protein
MTRFSYVLQHSAKRMAVLISLLAASGQVVRAQVAFSPPQNVSSNPGASSGPQTAVDSKGGINIVWTDYTPGYSVCKSYRIVVAPGNDRCNGHTGSELTQ